MPGGTPPFFLHIMLIYCNSSKEGIEVFFKERPYRYDWDGQILTASAAAASSLDDPKTKMVRFLNLQEKKIDITLNSMPVFTEVAWGESTGYIAAKARQNGLKLYPAGEKKAAFKKSLSKDMGEYVTFCIVDTHNGIDVLPLREESLAKSPGKAALRVILAGSPNGWMDVNFEYKKAGLRTLFPKVEPYTVSDYIYIPAESCSIQIVPADLGMERVSLDFKPEEQKNYSLYLSCDRQNGKSVPYAKILADRL